MKAPEDVGNDKRLQSMESRTDEGRVAPAAPAQDRLARPRALTRLAKARLLSKPRSATSPSGQIIVGEKVQDTSIKLRNAPLDNCALCRVL